MLILAEYADAKAQWLRPDVIVWPGLPFHDPRSCRWRLHWSHSADLSVESSCVSGGDSAPLQLLEGGLPDSLASRYPHLRDHLVLHVDRAQARRAAELAATQLRVSVSAPDGTCLDVSGVQLPGLLDSLFAATATRRSYGVTWRGRRPAFTLWAPTARRVHLLVWPDGDPDDLRQALRLPMQRTKDGAWTRVGERGWNNAPYLYEVEVYVPSTDRVETNLVTDPYSVALSIDSERSLVVNLDDRDLAPAQWRRQRPPRLRHRVDETVYELHVRDFSVSDDTVPADVRGSYLAFGVGSAGDRHLTRLAKAGLNTVHLLPCFDIASVPERPDRQWHPSGDLSAHAPDSDIQQEEVSTVAEHDPFNWGYDPWHWLAPEGSYCSSPVVANGRGRVREFRAMVGALHGLGLRVVMDQVYNHTAAAGQHHQSVLDRIVPGYYHRLSTTGAIEHSTCCNNIATEHAMAQKIMVDGVVLWARHYKVDGFRFDLMGHHSRDTMLAVRSALDALTVRRDGVDGRAITLYGEGWNFGEVANNARFVQATQGQLDGTTIATFNDRLRDAVRGGRPFDTDPRIQGWGSGLAVEPNGADGLSYEQLLAQSRHHTDLLALSLAGNLRNFPLPRGDGQVIRGEQVGYAGQQAGYATEPAEVLNYVDAHDNETLFDSLTYKLPRDLPMDDRVRMNTLCLATVALSQGAAFWHAGADMLRSKSLDRDSYNSGDWFNVLDFSFTTNGFGRGLPPAEHNAEKWPLMAPLLADPGLHPSPRQISDAHEQALDLLRLRFSTRLFRLGSADQIVRKVSFPLMGSADERPGELLMLIDDLAGTRVDHAVSGVLVVLNATGRPITPSVAGLRGQRWRLSPVQARGHDPIVRRSSWTAETARVQVPARTVAVFVRA